MQHNDDVAVTIYRGKAVENTHRAHVAVVDDDGRLLLASGDPLRQTFLRSAVKPAQALAVLETGAPDRFGFDAADLALMCGSHSSEARHVERARAMLAKTGGVEAELQCGGHPPISDAVARDWLLRGFTPTPLCNNCSGKHVGMIAAARVLGPAAQGYHQPEHPVQALVREAVTNLCGIPPASVVWALDDCNLRHPRCPWPPWDRFTPVWRRLRMRMPQRPHHAPPRAPLRWLASTVP